MRIGHKALFVIPYYTNAAYATSSNYYGVPARNFVIRDSEESSIVKKGRSIWDARARAERGGKTLSMPNTKGSAGHSGSFELRDRENNSTYRGATYFSSLTAISCFIQSFFALFHPGSPSAHAACRLGCITVGGIRFHRNREPRGNLPNK